MFIGSAFYCKTNQKWVLSPSVPLCMIMVTLFLDTITSPLKSHASKMVSSSVKDLRVGSLMNLSLDKHPVKVGVSDAYIIDKTVFHARRKTIFEYHRVNFPGPRITNFTTIR